MFRVESSTSYDGGVDRPYQPIDYHSAQIASDLARFLQERLCMEVVMVYRTGYTTNAPSAMCRVEFPRVGHGIHRFLVFSNLSQKTTPEEWAAGTDEVEFKERMLQEAARSLNLTLPSRLHDLEWSIERVQRILLTEAEQTAPA